MLLNPIYNGVYIFSEVSFYINKSYRGFMYKKYTFSNIVQNITDLLCHML